MSAKKRWELTAQLHSITLLCKTHNFVTVVIFQIRLAQTFTHCCLDYAWIRFPCRVLLKTLKLVFAASMLDARQLWGSVKQNLASSLDVPLGHTFIRIPPSLERSRVKTNKATFQYFFYHRINWTTYKYFDKTIQQSLLF